MKMCINQTLTVLAIQTELRVTLICQTAAFEAQNSQASIKHSLFKNIKRHNLIYIYETVVSEIQTDEFEYLYKNQTPPSDTDL